MSGTVGSVPYESTIPLLSDGASIIEAFKYYHTGVADGSSINPKSIQYHLQTINGRADTLRDQIGYDGISPAPASVQFRLSALETTVGTSISSTYVKMSPSSNDTNSTRNLISPATSGIIPLTVQGVLGQSASLQEWKTSLATVAKIDQTGKLFSYNGSAMAEVVTINGTQTITNKTLTNPISTISKSVKTATYQLSILTDQSSIIEVNSASAVNITVPLESDANGNFPVGSYLIIMQTGVGQVTIDPKIGIGEFVTVNSTPGLKLRTQWSMATLIKRGTNLWVASGDTIA